MLADFPGIRFLPYRLQTGHLSPEEFALSLSISLAVAAIAWAILLPKGPK